MDTTGFLTPKFLHISKAQAMQYLGNSSNSSPFVEIIVYLYFLLVIIHLKCMFESYSPCLM